jgi:hypothetical protein
MTETTNVNYAILICSTERGICGILEEDIIRITPSYVTASSDKVPADNVYNAVIHCKDGASLSVRESPEWLIQSWQTLKAQRLMINAAVQKAMQTAPGRRR